MMPQGFSIHKQFWFLIAAPSSGTLVFRASLENGRQIVLGLFALDPAAFPAANQYSVVRIHL
jgi:hypothetical protein